MSKRWLNERKHEFYYLKAKKLNYRSRASFKLHQIDERFGVFKPGGAVADLGAAPGGWLQVAKEKVGEQGKVVGVDLQAIEPLPGIRTIKGDITEKETVEELKSLLEGKADTVISDMAPNISGSYSMDHARSVDLCAHALDFARQVLKPGGSLVMKIFEGDMMNEFLAEVRKSFSSVRLHSPKASRSSSSEIYIIAKGFREAKTGPTEADKLAE
ncbi:RlmE family RNA methyltransferase [Methanomassiliicoccus luminyensis]|jgi:23S rRNA (uridine2552-2'-O)-methyltransferase|uniref:RlmE family RNA methyltransferase n=1 Tax=Methanomassiliicoccus luminyensis TaxID=1080712 RepID=UPI00036C7FC4|nr:RlmE family RNA methyltransferase [Methanomassiliicoccus luminyensis]